MQKYKEKNPVYLESRGRIAKHTHVRDNRLPGAQRALWCGVGFRSSSSHQGPDPRGGHGSPGSGGNWLAIFRWQWWKAQILEEGVPFLQVPEDMLDSLFCDGETKWEFPVIRNLVLLEISDKPQGASFSQADWGEVTKDLNSVPLAVNVRPVAGRQNERFLALIVVESHYDIPRSSSRWGFTNQGSEGTIHTPVYVHYVWCMIVQQAQKV